MAVPGKGFSSPVIFNKQIWMTSAENEGKSLHAICLDRTSGKLIYNIKVITTEDAGPRHRLNGYASPTPVIDKEHVFVHFGPRGTACLNKKGEIIAKLKAAKQLNDEEINNIKKDLTENFGTNLKLNFEHDPSLIGGLIIQIGSVMIDTSIKSKLQQLETKMIEA